MEIIPNDAVLMRREASEELGFAADKHDTIRKRSVEKLLPRRVQIGCLVTIQGTEPLEIFCCWQRPRADLTHAGEQHVGVQEK